MLPCRLSIRWEKRFVIWLRRPSDAEGSSSTTSSGSVELRGSSEASAGLGGSVDLGGVGCLQSSAYRRIWERILHCTQVDARIEGRLGIPSNREAGEEEAIESKTSLGANRAKGCMAGLYLLTSGRSSGVEAFRG